MADGKKKKKLISMREGGNNFTWRQEGFNVLFSGSLNMGWMIFQNYLEEMLNVQLKEQKTHSNLKTASLQV